MTKVREPVYPKTRRLALRAGDSKYKTGIPCKSGHVTYRYTASGACSGCISAAGIEARYGSPEKRDEAVTLREVREAAVRDLVETKLRCYDADLDTLRSVAVAVTMGRHPSLERQDIISNKPPGASEGGTRLHRFNVAPSDVDQLRATAGALLNARGPDIAAARQRMLAATLKLADDEADEPPPFVP